MGPELVPEFGPGGEAFFRPGPGDRLRLDVRAANAHQLREGGRARERRSTASRDCTFHEADRYHSYRREGEGRRPHDQLRGIRGLNDRLAAHHARVQAHYRMLAGTYGERANQACEQRYHQIVREAMRRATRILELGSGSNPLLDEVAPGSWPAT